MFLQESVSTVSTLLGTYRNNGSQQVICPTTASPDKPNIKIGGISDDNLFRDRNNKRDSRDFVLLPRAASSIDCTPHDGQRRTTQLCATLAQYLTNGIMRMCIWNVVENLASINRRHGKLQLGHARIARIGSICNCFLKTWRCWITLVVYISEFARSISLVPRGTRKSYANKIKCPARSINNSRDLTHFLAYCTCICTRHQQKRVTLTTEYINWHSSRNRRIENT